MQLSAVQMDRAIGALVGLAVGDALGAPYEFVTPGPAHADMIGVGGRWEPGEWTDDTQMAICIAEEAATGTIDALRVGERFLDWFRSDPKDVGLQTRAVLGRTGFAGELRAIAAQHFAANPTRSAGNGSLMRTAPVAIAHIGDAPWIVRSAVAISELTHGDPLAGEACVLWSLAIDRAIREGNFTGVETALTHLPDDRGLWWRAQILETRVRVPGAFVPNGFVVTALQAALASITNTPVPVRQSCRHLQDALRTAVSIGDDADTVAAIAGSLLGARWGASAVPFEWRRVLHGWPGYRVRDLARLAALAARGGQPNYATNWPNEPHLLNYYLRNYSLDGELRALPDDDGVLVGDVAALSDAVREVDVVFSLARVGCDDVPPNVEHHELWLIDSDDPADNPNLTFILADTAAAIATCRDEGKRVFIHCVRGEARTPAVAAAYIAHRLGLSATEAMPRVHPALPQARMNSPFAAALEELWPT